MKKITAIFLLLLTSWGIFQPATILAEEQNLPSGTVRNQISQKIEDFVRMETFIREILVIWIRRRE